MNGVVKSKMQRFLFLINKTKMTTNICFKVYEKMTTDICFKVYEVSVMYDKNHCYIVTLYIHLSLKYCKGK